MEVCFTFQWAGELGVFSRWGGGLGFDGGVKKILGWGEGASLPHKRYGKPCDWFITAVKHHEDSHF